jgi:hypothetical protein
MFQSAGGRGSVRPTDEKGTGYMEIAAPINTSACAANRNSAAVAAPGA